MKLHPLKLIILLLLVLPLGCNPIPNEASIEKWKQEIVETEHAFAAMAKSEGIPEAFLAYAADSAVLMRNNKLVLGKLQMADYFENQSRNATEMSLSWEPDFVDVSSSGDMGYTYGKFTFSVTDSTGVKQEGAGVFHTVWKRQQDGSWKFVWD